MKKIKKRVAIQLKHATKTYELHHEKPTLAEKVLKRKDKQSFTALKNLTISVREGDRIGIVGSNGSGKTTLLKVIAGISTLTSGFLFTRGKIVSLIDVSAGFHPDMTGTENIFLNGLIVGMSKKDLKEQYESIVSFADIGTFIDAPLYTYSEGMKLRLGFSVAIHASPDILILDEGIAAGDANFQEKLNKKVLKLFSEGKTILVVSHWLEYLEKNCTKFLWINKGKIEKFGGMEVLELYRKSLR